MAKLFDKLRIWLMEKYCKDGSVIIISHVDGKMRSSRYVLRDDPEADKKGIEQLGKTAARTVKVMLSEGRE